MIARRSRERKGDQRLGTLGEGAAERAWLTTTEVKLGRKKRVQYFAAQQGNWDWSHLIVYLKTADTETFKCSLKK